MFACWNSFIAALVAETCNRFDIDLSGTVMKSMTAELFIVRYSLIALPSSRRPA